MADTVVEAAPRKRKAPARSLRESTERTRVDRQVIDPALLSSGDEDDDEAFDIEASSALSDVPSDFDDDDDSDKKSTKSKRSKAGTATPLTTNSTTNSSATPTRAKFPSELKTIKCTIPGCTKAFNRPARLASHMRSHNNERPFTCPYDDCDKAYLEEKHLKQHVKGTHTNERDHQCYVEGCGKSFLTATRLRRHQAAHEGHERFRCSGFPPCAQSFRKHQTLQRHIRSDHLELTPYPCPYIDVVTGENCPAGYDSAGALRKHEDRVHGALRFWCDECAADGGEPTGYVTKAQLTKHMKTEHAGCLFCDLKCSSEKELQRHIETFHTAPKVDAEPKKMIACMHAGCDKSFTRKSNLEVHVRTAHEGYRFICGQTNIGLSARVENWNGQDACGADFVSKTNLEDHIRTQHLGLPSTVNARRVKKSGVGAIPKGPKGAAAHVLDPIAALTGQGYEQNREMACLVQGCRLRFMREYDRMLHLRAKHGFTPAEVPQLQGYQPDAARTIPCLAKDCNWYFFTQDELELHKQMKHDGVQPTVDQSLLQLSNDFKDELARGEHQEQYHVPDIPPQNLLFNQQTGVFEHYHGPTHAGKDYAECINLGCQHVNCAGTYNNQFSNVAASGEQSRIERAELNSNYFTFDEFGPGLSV